DGLLRRETRPVGSPSEGCESGRIGRSRKPLCLRAPWVQIPLPPPQAGRSRKDRESGPIPLLAMAMPGGRAQPSRERQLRGGFRMAGANGETLCTHGPDAAPAGIDARNRRQPEPATTTSPTPGTALSSTVQCYGTGSDGYRVQLIYAHASNVADRFGTYQASF